MGVITIQPQRSPFEAQLLQLYAMGDERAAERRRLAQQAAEFQQKFALDQELTDAQKASLAAAAGKASYDVASDRAAKQVAPLVANFEIITKNAGPARATEYMAGQAQRFGDDPEVMSLLKPYLAARDTLPSDETNANLERWKSDTTGRVAGGGQNAMDVNFSTLLGTGQQLSAPAFGNQDTREFGPDALKDAVAIADDRKPGATAKLQSQTQIQAGREQNASAERIAAARNAASTAPAASVPVLAGGATGKALLDSLDPATADLVRGVAEYRIDPTKAASSRNPKNEASERLKLIQLATQYDPSYDMTQFPSIAAARKDFTSGKAASNIRSLNTAMKHLDELDKAAKDLGNWQLPIANRVGNFVTRQAGGKSVTNFNSAATAVADELATLFKGTAGTDSAIAHWRDSLDPSMSPDQFQGQIDILLDLVGGRIAALEAQYKSTTGDPKGFKILSDKSREVLTRLAPEKAKIILGEGGAGDGAQRLSKEQVNKSTGERRVVYSDDGGATWHP